MGVVPVIVLWVGNSHWPGSIWFGSDNSRADQTEIRQQRYDDGGTEMQRYNNGDTATEIGGRRYGNGDTAAERQQGYNGDTSLALINT